MAGNPLSGHTNANMTLSGSASAADKLIDGSHILSPSITNLYEGVHGNGILLLQDTASGDSNNVNMQDVPESDSLNNDQLKPGKPRARRQRGGAGLPLAATSAQPK